jgi:hypothetical protein
MGMGFSPNPLLAPSPAYFKTPQPLNPKLQPGGGITRHTLHNWENDLAANKHDLLMENYRKSLNDYKAVQDV